MLDEQPRNRAERAVLQGDDADWHSGRRECDVQDLELSAPGGKTQYTSRESCEEASGRDETDTNLGGCGDHGRAWIIKSAGAKDVAINRPKPAFRRRHGPRFVHQLGK